MEIRKSKKDLTKRIKTGRILFLLYSFIGTVLLVLSYVHPMLSESLFILSFGIGYLIIGCMIKIDIECNILIYLILYDNDTSRKLHKRK